MSLFECERYPIPTCDKKGWFYPGRKKFWITNGNGVVLEMSRKKLERVLDQLYREERLKEEQKQK